MIIHLKKNHTNSNIYEWQPNKTDFIKKLGKYGKFKVVFFFFQKLLYLSSICPQTKIISIMCNALCLKEKTLSCYVMLFCKQNSNEHIYLQCFHSLRWLFDVYFQLNCPFLTRECETKLRDTWSKYKEETRPTHTTL